eukprot:6202280-Pleurochrysis_carterae.AAC.2
MSSKTRGLRLKCVRELKNAIKRATAFWCKILCQINADDVHRNMHDENVVRRKECFDERAVWM